MHRSRIGVVLIDAPPDSHDATRDFWGGVTGTTPEAEPDGEFAHVGTLGGGLKVETQRLGEGPARVHLDVETDDVAAEVARLEGLEATVEERREEHTILRDPAGLVFCVVPVWTDDFAAHAVEWGVTFTHDIRVRYQECDMQRVVFNAHYLTYCDETSAAWMGEVFGWTGADDDFDWMLVRAEVDWHSSATYGDTLRVVAEVARWGTTSFTVRYRGAVGERPVFTALITYVSVAPHTTTKTPVPEHVRAALGEPS